MAQSQGHKALESIPALPKEGEKEKVTASQVSLV